MRESIIYINLSVFLLLGLPTAGQQDSPGFIPNQGQWSSPESHRLELQHGSFFFEEQGYRVALLQIPHRHDAYPQKTAQATVQAARFQMEFAGSRRHPPQSQNSLNSNRNYFLGADSSHWRSEVPSYGELTYSKLYPGIDARYSLKNGGLKYDFHLAAGADFRQIKMVYHGLESLRLEGKTLILKTALSTWRESIPGAFQLIQGRKVPLSCSYRLDGDTVSFELSGNYDPAYPTVIDPFLEFSSYSGSGDLNYAHTATYGTNGIMYGAGINFGPHYPSTLGAVQSQFAGDSIFNVDVTVSKFSSDGEHLLYATYLGGKDIEVPHSLVTDTANNLYILGNTGSSNFPIHPDAFQKDYAGGTFAASLEYNDFNYGSDLFLTKINAEGNQVLGSTYWGGSGNDGLNDQRVNFGDRFRGEIRLSEDGDLALISSSHSTEIPGSNGPITRSDSSQDALVGLFNSDLTELKWGQFLGGSSLDAGYSLAPHGGALFITGSTESTDLLDENLEGQNTELQGGIDAFIIKMNLSDGAMTQGSYYGTPDQDQSFAVQADHFGNPYLTGQSRGKIVPTPGHYHNPSSSQFLVKWSRNLQQIEWQTTLGSTVQKQDWVPAAFYVDRCLQIYTAGWNGGANQIGSNAQNGNTQGLKVSNDAYQGSTDGSDFYFMVLGRNASSLKYASYFGGADHEHVDGGTNRFSPEGTLYQAICSNCNGAGLSGTPEAYASQSGNPNCNMMVAKFKFEQDLKAQAQIGYSTQNDTLCDALQVHFSNKSRNATHFLWRFGNGDSSSQVNPSVIYSQLGTYPVSLIAYDSICGVADTTHLTIDHTNSNGPKAEAKAHYLACDQNFRVRFSNKSEKSQTFQWDFGDGDRSNQEEPEHLFADPGPHSVRLIAYDSICEKEDSTSLRVHFRDTIPDPVVQVDLKACSNGEVNIRWENFRPRYEVTWNYQNQRWRGPNPDIQFQRPGFKNLAIHTQDSLCHQDYEQRVVLDLQELRQNTFIPDAFSPNGDGLNESFIIHGDACDEQAELSIFNRWGQQVFHTEQPFRKFWSGNFRGHQVPAGIYTYSLHSSHRKYHGHITLIR